MTDEQRMMNGNLLTSLWKLSDQLFGHLEQDNTCGECLGDGYITVSSGYNIEAWPETCPVCRGKGTIARA